MLGGQFEIHEECRLSEVAPRHRIRIQVPWAAARVTSTGRCRRAEQTSSAMRRRSRGRHSRLPILSDLVFSPRHSRHAAAQAGSLTGPDRNERAVPTRSNDCASDVRSSRMCCATRSCPTCQRCPPLETYSGPLYAGLDRGHAVGGSARRRSGTAVVIAPPCGAPSGRTIAFRRTGCMRAPDSLASIGSNRCGALSCRRLSLEPPGRMAWCSICARPPTRRSASRPGRPSRTVTLRVLPESASEPSATSSPSAFAARWRAICSNARRSRPTWTTWPTCSASAGPSALTRRRVPSQSWTIRLRPTD